MFYRVLNTLLTSMNHWISDRCEVNTWLSRSCYLWTLTSASNWVYFHSPPSPTHHPPSPLPPPPPYRIRIFNLVCETEIITSGVILMVNEIFKNVSFKEESLHHFSDIVGYPILAWWPKLSRSSSNGGVCCPQVCLFILSK